MDYDDSIAFYDAMFGWLGYRSFWTLDIEYRSTYYMARFPAHSYIGIQPAASGQKLRHSDQAGGITKSRCGGETGPRSTVFTMISWCRTPFQSSTHLRSIPSTPRGTTRCSSTIPSTASNGNLPGCSRSRPRRPVAFLRTLRSIGKLIPSGQERCPGKPCEPCRAASGLVDIRYQGVCDNACHFSPGRSADITDENASYVRKFNSVRMHRCDD